MKRTLARVATAGWISLRSLLARLPMSAEQALAGGLILLAISGVGHLFFATDGLHEPGRLAFEGVALIALPLVTIAAVAWTSIADDSSGDERILAWAVVGTCSLLAVAGLFLLVLGFEGVEIRHPTGLLLLAVNLGAAFGVTVGVRNAYRHQSIRRAERAEARAELAERHERQLAFLNRILRHHVLNGISVIQGYTAELRKDARPDQEDALAIIHEQSEQTVDYVGDMRGLLKCLTGELSPIAVDLSAVINASVRSARATHPDVEFRTDVPADLAVVGTHLLDLVFENLLGNAAKHNDASNPVVEVAVPRVDSRIEVVVSDNGPGFPDDRKEAYFEGTGAGKASLGEGLDLYFVETIISQSGGAVWIEDGDDGGTEVHVEFVSGRRPTEAAVDQIDERLREAA